MYAIDKHELTQIVESLQTMFVDVAENKDINDMRFRNERRFVLENVEQKELIPQIVRDCRDQKMIWAKMSAVATNGGSWAARREYIWGQFAPLLDHLESPISPPYEAGLTNTLSEHDFRSAEAAWRKASSRIATDPEGAITAARSLVESVCKTILDDRNVRYETSDLPGLYRLVCKELNLSPSGHGEQVFKQVLSGCVSVVQGLGGLRNAAGDSHGQGRRQYKPDARHATLAVNLAGSMAVFLVQTHASKLESSEAA